MMILKASVKSSIKERGKVKTDPCKECGIKRAKLYGEPKCANRFYRYQSHLKCSESVYDETCEEILEILITLTSKVFRIFIFRACLNCSSKKTHLGKEMNQRSLYLTSCWKHGKNIHVS
jgi:hypothetical protein